MEEEKKAYRTIFKATALFGGVQVFNILLALIRTKIVAVLLGVNGVGLLGMLSSTLAMVTNVTSLGVDKGAVRDISMAQNSEKKGVIATVVRRWSLFTGLFGAVTVLSMAPLLSQWSFGTEKYTLAFCWLACTMLFDAVSKGQLAIFQGMRFLKILAKSNLIGASASLILSIPIYYVWGIDGVVPALILTSLCSLLFTTLFYYKAHIPKATVTSRQVLHQGQGIINLGVMLTISGFIATLGSYIFNIYLSQCGGLQDVGLYQAGFNLIEKYVGLIFVAMGTDYYPRLATVNQDNDKMEEMVNQQAIMGLLIVCPIVCLFLPTAPLIVRIILSEQFLPIIPFVSWAILGVAFKVASWSMGYVLIVKGRTKLFLISELISWLTILFSNIIGYTYWGITGIGIAFLFGYICYCIQMIVISKFYFNITFNRELLYIGATTLLLSCSSFLTIQYGLTIHQVGGYIVSALIFGLALFLSIKQINKKTELKKYFTKGK